jgi:hypothetical protein
MASAQHSVVDYLESLQRAGERDGTFLQYHDANPELYLFFQKPMLASLASWNRSV